MPISLPNLPFDKNALAPYISEQTLDFHHGKHHSTYVTNVNKLIDNSEFANEDLEGIIKKTAKEPTLSGIFNNAAQVWNHTFYWSCMKPGGGGPATGPIAERIKAGFGGYESFAEQFKNAGLTQFGSGWAWLVLKNSHLEIMKTGNADTPLAHGIKALLTVDVWEHAYYLDYQNRRGDYLAAFMEHLVNWDFVNSQLV
jgi:Fe-Mn family superoxide dismutase